MLIYDAFFARSHEITTTKGSTPNMLVSHTQAVVRIAVAGMALGLVLAGCSKGDSSSGASSESSSASTSAASSSEESTTTSAAAAAAPDPTADYSSLLIKPEDVPEVAGAFIADPPQLNPNGVAGAAQLLHNAENTAMIGDTVLLTESPEKAAAALEKSKEGISASVTGTPEPLPSVAANAVIAAGTSPDGSKAVTVLLFSEQNTLVSLEFDSAPGDLNPVPTDFVQAVGLAQLEAIKAELPNVK
jgi:hypothetical protein